MTGFDKELSDELYNLNNELMELDIVTRFTNPVDYRISENFLEFYTIKKGQEIAKELKRTRQESIPAHIINNKLRRPEEIYSIVNSYIELYFPEKYKTFTKEKLRHLTELVRIMFSVMDERNSKDSSFVLGEKTIGPNNPKKYLQVCVNFKDFFSETEVRLMLGTIKGLEEQLSKEMLKNTELRPLRAQIAIICKKLQEGLDGMKDVNLGDDEDDINSQKKHK
jgi:hypothetical protein